MRESQKERILVLLLINLENMSDDNIQKAQQEFDKAIKHLMDEYARLQIGRASASIVEHVTVEAYGTNQPIRNLANISIPDPKTISIQPWDKTVLSSIEKAIREANLGFNPINDGLVVRINIPPLTEERRKELSRVVYQLAEEAKIAVRNSRQTIHNGFKESKEKSLITEDDFHNYEKKLQDKVDEANKKIDELAKQKDSDIMTV